MAIPLELLVTENPRGGYLVYPWAGSRARTVKFGPHGAARGLRGLNDAVMEALALDLIDPDTGEGEAPPMSSSNLSEVQSTLSDGKDALVHFDPKTGRYDISSVAHATARMSMREVAAKIASTNPELALDLVHISEGPIEGRVAMRWALSQVEL